MRSPVALPAGPLSGHAAGLDRAVVVGVDDEGVGHGCSVGAAPRWVVQAVVPQSVQNTFVVVTYWRHGCDHSEVMAVSP